VTNCRAGTCLSEGEPPVSRNLCRYDAMVPCIKTVGVVDVSLFLRTAQAGDINIMKRLGILLFEISPCALGMSDPGLRRHPIRNAVSEQRTDTDRTLGGCLQ
jgi:hypothetical protein